MNISLQIFWTRAERVETGPECDLSSLYRLLQRLPGLTRALVHQPLPETAGIPQDGNTPVFGMQIDFDTIEALEAASAKDGALQGLRAALPAGVADARATQQAFLLRSYLPPFRGAEGCSYVVHYPGPAQDTGAWLAHYRSGHIPLMCRLPGIREVEMLTRIDWISALDFPRAAHMQRNRVLFDSPDALRNALASPIRNEMRKDTADYPPYEGGMFHYPMKTNVIRAAKA
ncbi:EthD family reductase [Pseudotabrizicola sp. 4114]|uniref:EthD family reductase n=1 Tax=Pseudotabrizicola sp. 4114 TaxID=2817731 RepID=UPI0028563330|nr:uncharacterized protein (TIGR02118 family) [Pseudorhodobacter sp. 4114]